MAEGQLRVTVELSEKIIAPRLSDELSSNPHPRPSGLEVPAPGHSETHTPSCHEGWPRGSLTS